MELTRKISFELDRMFSCGSATKHKLTRKLSAYQAHEKNIDQASIDSSICGEIILNENMNVNHETLVPPPLPLDPNPDQNPVQPSEKSNRRSKTPQKIEIVRSYSSMIDKNRRCSREKSSSPTKSSSKSNKSPINQRKSLHQRSNNCNDPPEPVYDEIGQNAHRNHHKTLRHSHSSVRSEISSEKTGIREKTRVRIRVSKSKSRERDSHSSTRKKLSIRGPTSQNENNDGQHYNNDNSSHQKVQPCLSNEIFNLADRERSDPRRRSLRRRKSKNPLSLSNSVSDNHILPNGQLSASKPILSNNDNNNNTPEKRTIPNYYTTTTCTSEQDSNANDSTSYSHIDNKQNQSNQTNHLLRKPSAQETIDMVEKLELTSSKLVENYDNNKNSTYSSHNSKSKQKLKIKVSGKLKTNYSNILTADNESSQVLEMNSNIASSSTNKIKSSVNLNQAVNFKNYCDTAIYDNLNGHMRPDVSDLSIKNSYSPTLEKLNNSNNQNKSNNIFNNNTNKNNNNKNLTIREKIRSARELGQKNFARKNFDKIYNLANLPSLIRSGIINHQEIHGNRTEDENCQNIGHDFSDGKFETALIDQWRRDFGVRAANKMYVTLQNTRYSLKELNSFRSGSGSF